MLGKKGLFTAVLLVVSVMFLANSVAFAKKWQHRRSTPFSAMGTVTAIDPTQSTLTMTVEKANRVLKPFIGAPEGASFVLAEDVKVKLEGTEPGEFDLTVEDIEVGDTVRVMGKKVSAGYEIRRIVLFESAE